MATFRTREGSYDKNLLDSVGLAVLLTASKASMIVLYFQLLAIAPDETLTRRQLRMCRQ